MTNPKSKLTPAQIAQNAYDDAQQAIRVIGDLTATVDFPSEQEVELSAQDGDSVIAAGTTDGTLSGPVKAIRTLSDGTVVVTSSGGTFVQVNPTDFRAATYTATDTPQAISFPGFTIVSVSIMAPPTNTVSVRIGKSDVSTNYFFLTPGSSLNLPLQGSVSPVYYQIDASGDAQISVLALGS